MWILHLQTQNSNTNSRLKNFSTLEVRGINVNEFVKKNPCLFLLTLFLFKLIKCFTLIPKLSTGEVFIAEKAHYETSSAVIGLGD